MDIEFWKRQFYNYYCEFDTTELPIVCKYQHSIRVMNLCRELAVYNKLSENDVEIAALIGLLHDIARFLQWTTYRTYSDIKSIDHGDLGVKILFEDGKIRNYIADNSYDEVIYNAIKYHNKFSVPEGLDERNNMFCKLIRDADKLDIFYLLGVDKNLLVEDDCDISKDIENDFYDNKLLSRVKVRNCSDSILLDLAMIFDFNFIYSYKHIDENNLIWKMYDNLNNKDRFYDYFVYVDKYVKGKLSNE